MAKSDTDIPYSDVLPKEMINEFKEFNLTRPLVQIYLMMLSIVIVVEVLAVAFGAKSKWIKNEECITYYAVDKKTMIDLIKRNEGKSMSMGEVMENLDYGDCSNIVVTDPKSESEIPDKKRK